MAHVTVKLGWRRFALARFLVILIVIVSLFLFSERFRWFAFNQLTEKGVRTIFRLQRGRE
jgi:hypothetical protein